MDRQKVRRQERPEETHGERRQDALWSRERGRDSRGSGWVHSVPDVQRGEKLNSYKIFSLKTRLQVFSIQREGRTREKELEEEDRKAQIREDMDREMEEGMKKEKKVEREEEKRWMYSESEGRDSR